jgi:hypothetical protein
LTLVSSEKQKYNDNEETTPNSIRRETDHAPMILQLPSRVTPSHADGNPGLPIRLNRMPLTEDEY